MSIMLFARQFRVDVDRRENGTVTARSRMLFPLGGTRTDATLAMTSIVPVAMMPSASVLAAKMRMVVMVSIVASFMFSVFLFICIQTCH